MPLLLKNITKKRAKLVNLNEIARRELSEALDRQIKPLLVKSHNLVVADWQHKPKFQTRKEIRAAKISMTVFPVGDIGGIQVAGYFVNDFSGHLFCKPILTRIPDEAVVVGAMVSPKRMEFIKEIEFLVGYPFALIIHPSCSVSKTAYIGNGSIINRLVAVSAYAIIGKHTIINRSASIGHHAMIGPFCTIGPGANIAGNVTIGENAVIGMGANILEGRTVGKGAIVGAGAVVTRDVPDYAKAIGIPAKWTSR